MKVLLLVLVFVAVQAKDPPGLRGLSIDEDERFYERLLEQDVSSFATDAPTPCSNILRECPANCFLEALDEARPLNCAALDQEGCNSLPLPTDVVPECPDCCPDECSRDNPMFDGGDCAPTPLPSPSPTLALTPPPTKAPTTSSPTAASIILTPSPSDEPSVGSSDPPTGAPSSCSDILVQCPNSCFEVDEAERPLNCTSPGVDRPDCDSLPFPPAEDCPLCCPQDCFMDLMGCDPTPVPTVEPSSAPSSVPTPCKNLVDECPERCWEVDPFNRLPLCTDFNRPDCDTLPFPSDLNCPTCCPTQCIDAPELGDCSPTPLPTPSPSTTPSMLPTEAPTAEPSTSPSSNPTQCIPPPNCPSICGEENPPTNICSAECIACPPDECDVDIQINPNCPELPCEWNICEERPFRMQFLFKGGDCSFTDFRRCPGDDPDLCTCTRERIPEEDWPNQITCEDFNGGPPAPTTRGALSWLRLEGKGEIYFEGVVEVGSSFNASTIEDEVEANTDIFIFEYDEANDGPGQLLQEVVFHSSCSQELYLADTYGSIQLTEFESEDQLVSLFRTSTFAFDLTLQLETDASSIELTTANMVLLSSNFLDPQLQSLDVEGTVIPPALVVNADFTIIPEEDHTIIASIGGLLDGRECFGLVQETFNCPRG